MRSPLLLFNQLWLAVALCAGCVPAMAQVTATVDVKTVVLNADQFKKVGNVLVIPDDGKIRVQNVAMVIYSGVDGYKLTVSASDINRVPVPVEKAAPNTYIVKASGEAWVDLLGINWDKQDLVSKQTKIKVPPLPSPTPDDDDDDVTPTPDDDDDNPAPPDPNVPTDQFDNIGQRVNGWALGLPGRRQTAAVFRWAADELVNNLTRTQNEVGEEYAQRLKDLPDFNDYIEFHGKVKEDFTTRWPMNRVLQAEYFNAIATGLEAGQ